jgi:carbamate kinase
LGGNAFLRKGERGSYEDYLRNVLKAARAIVKAKLKGYDIVVTHGNGPQVGAVLEWMVLSRSRTPSQPMDVANAMTQGWLGYLLQQAIGNVMELYGLSRRVVALVTQVVVDVNDPAFREPTKYVGPYYSEDEAKRLATLHGWVFKRDPRGGWRRVVPSPKPVSIVEIDAIRALLKEGYVVIAVGGGGVPVTMANGLKGVEAVIDKDLASALLAIELGAERLVILTDVDGVYLNYGKPGQRLLKVLPVSEALKLLSEGQFPPGSMGPKVEAAVEFVRATGRVAVIGSLDQGVEVIEGRAGTRVVPG